MDYMVKKFKIPIIIIAITLFLLMASWFAWVSRATVYHENIVESMQERPGYFTAEGTELLGIRLCQDNESFSHGSGENEISDNLPDTYTICLENSSEELVLEQVVLKSEIPFRTFGNEITVKTPVKLIRDSIYYIYIRELPEKSGITFLLREDATSLKTWFIVFSIVVMMIVLLLCFLWIHWINNPYALQQVFVPLCLLFGVLSSLIYKPLGVPDENIHFAEAYHLSNELMGREDQENYPYHVYYYESGIFRSIQEENTAQALYRFYCNYTYGNESVEAESQTDSFVHAYVTYEYYPAAMGILIVRLLRLPYQWIYLIGRGVNILIYSLVLALAMRICNGLELAIAAIGLLPSSIWIATSFSYDGWNLAFCMLFVAYCVRLTCSSRETRILDIVLGLIIFALFAPIKMIYMILGLLFVAIPLRKWKNKKQVVIAAAAMFTGTIIALRSRLQEAMSLLLTASTDTRGLKQGLNGEPYTLGWVVHNLPYTYQVFLKTFLNNCGVILEKIAIGEWYYSLVPTGIVFGILAVLFLSLLLTFESSQNVGMVNNMPWKRLRVFAAIAFGIGVFMIMATFLFSYSYRPNYGIGEISGVQGRYFLPLLILVPFLFSNSFREKVHIKHDALVLNSKKNKPMDGQVSEITEKQGLFLAMNFLSIMAFYYQMLGRM